MKQDNSLEIRWHGRGGQGAVTSAELTALAAIHEGKFAQAFPSFGPERRGAPVLAFNRINADQRIRIRSGIARPDIVVVLDPGLVTLINVTDGLKPGGWLIVNSPLSIEEIQQEFSGNWKLAVVDAHSIARDILGINIVNTTMLGALIKATNAVKLESLEELLKEKFGPKAKANLDACMKAYHTTVFGEINTAGIKKIKDFKVERMSGWQGLLAGCVVNEPGNTKQFSTGDWKSQHPTWNDERCIQCGMCDIVCPECCVKRNNEGQFRADLYYCKGCGICAHECWPQAITMVDGA